MLRGRSLAWVGLALLATGAAACKDSPAVGTVRGELEAQIEGAEFEEEFHLRLGRLSLGIGRKIAGWVLADDEDLTSLLESVKRLDVGSYRVVSLPPLAEIEPPAALMSRIDEAGWTLAVSSSDEDERIWMFVREDEGSLRNIYVVALDESELTMVSLEGRLDELLAEAIAADPAGFAASLAG